MIHKSVEMEFVCEILVSKRLKIFLIIVIQAGAHRSLVNIFLNKMFYKMSVTATEERQGGVMMGGRPKGISTLFTILYFFSSAIPNSNNGSHHEKVSLMLMQLLKALKLFEK